MIDLLRDLCGLIAYAITEPGPQLIVGVVLTLISIKMGAFS